MTTSRARSTFTPRRKNVALMPRAASTSSSAGVAGPGPSSNVSATRGDILAPTISFRRRPLAGEIASDQRARPGALIEVGRSGVRLPGQRYQAERGHRGIDRHLNAARNLVLQAVAGVVDRA